MTESIGTRRGSRQAILGWRSGAIGGGNPSTIFGANLIVWAKADTGVTLSGSNVTGWADQSGNSHDFTVFDTDPTFSNTGFNSLPGITFASNTGLVSSATFNIAKDTAGFFLVGNFTTNVGGNLRLLAYYNTVGQDFNTTAGILAFNNDTNAGTVNALHNSSAATAMTVTSGNNARLGCTYDGPAGAIKLYNNNGTPTTTTGYGDDTLGSSCKLAIGENTAGTGCAMTIGEVVMVNIVPSGTQLTNLDNYFKTKWGL